MAPCRRRLANYKRPRFGGAFFFAAHLTCGASSRPSLQLCAPALEDQDHYGVTLDNPSWMMCRWTGWMEAVD